MSTTKKTTVKKAAAKKVAPKAVAAEKPKTAVKSKTAVTPKGAAKPKVVKVVAAPPVKPVETPTVAEVAKQVEKDAESFFMTKVKGWSFSTKVIVLLIAIGVIAQLIRIF